MDRAIHKGIHYVVLKEHELSDISPEPFIWGDQSFEVNSKFEKLGSKSRTSLQLGAPLIYKGVLGPYVLFDVEVTAKKPIQGSLFEDQEKKPYFFIAIARINHSSLLMQSSPAGFWDITV